MDLETLKILVITGLASDDRLMETLVLKGGNAISLYERKTSGRISRASYDLDYSMGNDMDPDELDSFSKRIEGTLRKTFRENGYQIIDYVFHSKPSEQKEETKDFWGGYSVEFKIVTTDVYKQNNDNIELLRRKALSRGPRGSTKVIVEISKFEFVEGKVPHEVDGFTVYVYSPEMIVFEKIRAICQQDPAYKEIVPSHSPRRRARDFYDIFTICEAYGVKLITAQSKQLLQQIFEAKKVPLSYLGGIGDQREFHAPDWQSVLDTVSAKEDLLSYDDYFNFVIELVSAYQSPLG
jgi:predicted nucleotidyltransferase component of viral defense system